MTNTLFNYLGLDPSGYRASIAHKDENDALLGGETQMSDEERFKVRFVFVYFISRVSVRQAHAPPPPTKIAYDMNSLFLANEEIHGQKSE